MLPGAADWSPLGGPHRPTLPSPELQSRSEEWRDLRVLRLSLPLLRSGPKGVQVLQRQSFRVRIEGASFGRPSISSAGERALALVNPQQAANWAAPRPLQRAVTSSFEGDTWVRIPVRESGLYRITPNRLAELGLNPGAYDPAGMRVYSYDGREIPRDPAAARNSLYRMNELPVLREHDGNGVFDGSDRLLFYGHGLFHLGRGDDGGIQHFEHFYGEENFYWLMLGGLTAGREMQSIVNVGGTLVEKLPWRGFIDENTTSHDNSALAWYGDAFVNRNSIEYSWPLALDGSLASIGIDYDFVYSTQPSNTRDSLQFTLNDQLFWGQGVRPSTTALIEDDLVLSGNELRLGIRQLASTGIPVLLDEIEITVQTPPAFLDGEVSFESPTAAGAFQVQVGNFPSGGYLLEVSRDDSVRVLRQGLLGDRVPIDPADSSRTLQRRYYGCSPEAIRDIERATLADPPLLDAGNDSELIVIAPAQLAESARRLVDHRNAEGRLRARLVTLEEVYAAYNAGVPDPAAVRNFLKHQYEAGLPAPSLRYVLLAGGGHYDPRGLIEGAWPDLFPAWYRNTSMLDELYGRLLNGSFMDIAVGRLPVWSASELDAYIDKLIAYESPEARGDWRNRLLFVGDDEHGENDRVLRWESDHTQHNEYLIDNLVPPAFDSQRIYSIDFPRVYNPEIRVYEKPLAEKALLDALEEGASLINYIGHGNNTTWTHEYLFNTSKHLSLLPSNNRPALYIAATCSWAEIDLPIGLALPQQLISFPAGGAIGIMAATRNTTSGGNDRFAQALYSALFLGWNEAGHPRITVAEAMRQAKNSTTSSNDDLYLYLGDPSMLPGFPGGSGALEQVLGPEGTAVDTLLTLELASLGFASEDPRDGTTVQQGQAFVEVREAPVPRKYYYELSAGYTVPDSLLYEAPGALLFSGRTEMSGGQTEARFVMPADFSGRPAPGRIRLYYEGETGSGEAEDGVIYNAEVPFARNPDPAEDSSAPSVELLFNGPHWREGDPVAPNSAVYLLLEDENGINLTGEIGHRIELEIDGETPIDLTDSFVYETGSYTRGTAVRELPLLEPGEHTARVRAFDNFNNPGYAETRFTVLNTGQLRLTDLVNFPNPVKSDTRFTFRLADLALEAPPEVELSVYTTRGRRVFRDALELSGNESLYYTEHWRPRDDRGDPLARGVYLYRLSLAVPPTSYTRVDELGNLVSATNAGGEVTAEGTMIVH